jgi:hypothetical protein
VIPRRFDNIVG